MKVGSLFSGCGGTALGFEWAGFEHSWFVEVDEYARATLRKNFPEAIIYGDITTVDFRTVPKIDVLEGGFPCQDISNAGKRAGITGSRSSLWKHFARAIGDLRPQVVSIENVSALTRRGLDVVLCDLATLGYDAEWHCISASAVGAPHRRDRIFIVAYPCSERRDNGSDNREERPVLHDKDWYAEKNKSEREGRECGFREACSDVAYPNEWRWNEGDKQQHNETREQQIRENEPNNRNKVWSELRTSNSFNGWWATEPDVGRVAHGVPSRMDRIKCLGNAVVPQNAEIIAKAIKEVRS